MTTSSAGGVTPPVFTVAGSLKFRFMDIDFNPSFDISLALSEAPQKLSELGAILLAWIRNALKDLMSKAWKDAKAFADWVQAHFDYFKDAANDVAALLKAEFGVVSDDVAKGLMQGM